MINDALKTNNTLTELSLLDNHIGVEETRMICETLKTNTTMTGMDLSCLFVFGD